MDEIRVLDCENQGLDMKREVELKKAELEKSMEVYNSQYEGLCLEVQKLLLRNNGVDDELEKWKATCDGLTQRVSHLEEEKKGADDELKKWKETCDGLTQRVSRLEDEKKVFYEREERKKDENKMYVRELKKKIWNLQCGERKAEGEIEYWKNRFTQLETESQSRIKREAELEEELVVYRVKYDTLSVEVEEKKKEIEGKLKGLTLKKMDADYELNKYKKTCEGLKERISRLDEDQKVVCEREKEANARISYLEMELRKKGSDESSKYVELITENRDLECAKKRAEDEINDWKKRFGELKGMLLDRMAIEDELKEYKKTCDELKERIKDLEEQQKHMCEKKKRAQDKITNLEEELKKKESDDREKYVERLTLESGKKSAEDEVNVWKKRFGELETQILRLNQVALEKSDIEKELEASKIQCHVLSGELEEKKLECSSALGKLKYLLLKKIVVDDELKVYKTTCNGLKVQIMGLEGNQMILCEKEKRAQERIIYLEERIKSIESDEREKYLELVKQLDTGVWKKQFKDLETQVLRLKQVELEKAELEKEFERAQERISYLEEVIRKMEDDKDVHITGTASTVMQSMPLVNVKERIENIPLKSKVDSGSRVRKEQVFELEGSSTKKPALLLEQDSVRPASGGMVDISDSEDEQEYVSMDNTSKRSSDNEKDLQPKKCLKRPCSNLITKEYWSTFEDYIPLSPALKTSASKTTQVTEGVHKFSALNTSGGTLSSEGQNVENSMSPSRRRLRSLRQCEEKKNWVQRTSRNVSSSPYNLEMSETSYQKPGNLISKNKKEHMVHDVPLGEIFTCSDSSDSGDNSINSEHARDMDLSLNQLISNKKNRVKESKWQFEADMLSSFEVDSELCMKAVCALYRQQISEEKSKGSLHSHNRGFNTSDTLRPGSTPTYELRSQP